MSDAAAPSDPAGWRGALSVLLVDDDWMGQAVSSAILEEMGYEVVTAASGAEAVGRWEQGELDLIFMDVQMPGMDGCAATRLIRAREAGSGRHIPIIALTADSGAGDQQACLAAGMDHCLGKPVQPDLIRQAVDGVLARLSTARPAEAPSAPTPNRVPEAADAEMAGILAELGLQPLGDAAGAGDASEVPAELQVRLDQEFGAPLTDAVLDEDALGRLTELEKRGALSVGKVVALFTGSGEGILPALRASLAVGAAPVLRREAHTLKGNARNVGAHRLANLCQELEARARDGKLDGAAELIGAVEAAWVEAQRALQVFLEQRG